MFRRLKGSARLSAGPERPLEILGSGYPGIFRVLSVQGT